MVSESQFVKIKGFLADAKASGANFLTGGDTPQEKGYFFSPTVITDVGIDDDVWQKEVRCHQIGSLFWLFWMSSMTESTFVPFRNHARILWMNSILICNHHQMNVRCA